MNIVKKIIDNAKNDYHDFKQTMLTKSNVIIFGNAYKISAFTTLNSYFQDQFEFDVKENPEIFTEDTLKTLPIHLLDLIYDIHFDYEDLYITLYDNIKELLIDYIVER